MLTTTTSNSSKRTSSSLSALKKAILGVSLGFSCLNPIAILAQSNSDTQQLEQQKADYELAKENLNTEMATYMVLNPKASAAVIASGSGAAAVITENLSGGQKAFFVGMGLLGLNHCRQSVNIQKCAEVATNVGSYATQINNYNEQIDLLAEQISSSQDYVINTAPSYSPESSWIPGTPHSDFDNIVAGDTEGNWKPASGYKWANPEDDDDFRVIPLTFRLER